LSQNMLFSNVLSPVHFWLYDKSGTDSHVDCVPGLSILGLPKVALGSVTLTGSKSARRQAGEQQLLSTSVRVLPAEGQRAGELGTATCDRAAHTAAKEGYAVATDAAVDSSGRRLLAQKISVQELAASGCSSLPATVEETARPGSSTPAQTKLNAHALSWPQKIMPASAAWDQAARANHWPIDGQSLGAQADAAPRSSTQDAPVANGMDQVSTFAINCFNSKVDGNDFLMAGGNLFNTGIFRNTMGALDLAKENEGEEFMLHSGEGKLHIDDQNRVGIASPQMVIGNFSTPVTNELNSSFSLNLIECSPHNVPVNHTVEEVIAFGVFQRPHLE
jgi:hypothetical protein